MSDEGFDVEFWLGADVGGKRLPERVQLQLKKSFTEKSWDEGMLPEDGTVEAADLKDAVELFVSILDDSSGSTPSTKLGAAMKTAAKQWFTARVKEENEEDGGTVDADGTPSFGRVTPQIQVVLDKNGMPDQKSLFGFELSFYLGRPAAPQELEGAIFGAPPSVMLGATKNKKMHSDQNFDKIIKEAERSGDPAPVRSWLQRTSSLLAKSTLMPHHQASAHAILSFLNKSMEQCSDGYTLIVYMRLIRENYSDQSRGLPEDLVDNELVKRAENINAARLRNGPVDLGALSRKPPPSLADTMSDLSSESGALPASSVGPSASQTAGASESGPIMAKLDKIVSTVQSLSDRLGNVETFQKNVAGGGCFKCGGDHKAQDCPVGKKGK